MREERDRETRETYSGGKKIDSSEIDKAVCKVRINKVLSKTHRSANTATNGVNLAGTAETFVHSAPAS